MVSGLGNRWCIRLIFRAGVEPFVLVGFPKNYNSNTYYKGHTLAIINVFCIVLLV